MPETDLTDLIVAEAALPKSSETDGQEAEGRSLNELVAADKHLAVKRATTTRRSGWRSIATGAVVPPGAGP